MPRHLACLLTILAAFLATTPGPAHADAVADFYRGKTLNLLIGTTPGSEYDLHARLVARHIGRHLPGNPTLVPQNMAGAGGLNMANHLYVIAPKDGTVIGTIPNQFPALQASGGRGIQFDAAKFQWIGAVAPNIETMALLTSTGAKTLEDARQRELIAGAVGKGSMTYLFPALFNELLGTKFKIVAGYAGTSDIILAMERGEVEARENTWSAWKLYKPEWLIEKKITIIARAGPPPPELADVPAVEDFARSSDERALIALILSGTRLGRPLVAPPGVPADRVQALRAAFDAAVRDPALLADAATSRIEVDALHGEAMQQRVAAVLATRKDLAARAREFLE